MCETRLIVVSPSGYPLGRCKERYETHGRPGWPHPLHNDVLFICWQILALKLLEEVRTPAVSVTTDAMLQSLFFLEIRYSYSVSCACRRIGMACSLLCGDYATLSKELRKGAASVRDHGFRLPGHCAIHSVLSSHAAGRAGSRGTQAALAAAVLDLSVETGLWSLQMESELS